MNAVQDVGSRNDKCHSFDRQLTGYGMAQRRLVKLLRSPGLREYVVARPRNGWSPQQIAGRRSYKRLAALAEALISIAATTILIRRNDWQ